MFNKKPSVLAAILASVTMGGCIHITDAFGGGGKNGLAKAPSMAEDFSYSNALRDPNYKICMEDSVPFRGKAELEKILKLGNGSQILILGDGSHLSPSVKAAVIDILSITNPVAFGVEGFDGVDEEFLNSGETIVYSTDRRDGLVVTEFNDLIQYARNKDVSVHGVDEQSQAIFYRDAESALKNVANSMSNNIANELGNDLAGMSNSNLRQEIITIINDRQPVSRLLELGEGINTLEKISEPDKAILAIVAEGYEDMLSVQTALDTAISALYQDIAIDMRNKAMAENIVKIRSKTPDGLIVVFIGAEHAQGVDDLLKARGLSSKSMGIIPIQSDEKSYRLGSSRGEKLLIVPETTLTAHSELYGEAGRPIGYDPRKFSFNGPCPAAG